MGQGKDYVYHGKTEFIGEHAPHDILRLSIRQNEKFFGIKDHDIKKRKKAGDIFPEYYILRVNDFDKVATTPLDEWIEFLKTGTISSKATAAGLPEARERLRVDALSPEDKQAYFRHMENVRHMKSLFDTSHDEGFQEGHEEGFQEGHEEGFAKGREEGREEGAKKEKIENAKRFLELGLPQSKLQKAPTSL